MPPLDPACDQAGVAATNRRVDLKVGFSCNNRCSFCVQGDKRSHIPDRTGEEVRALLAERRAVADGVVFTGGEPTVRSDLVELVAYARALGYRTIQIQTNGRRMAYRPFVAALVRAGATEVSPALHGSSAEIHDAMTRAPRAFEQTARGIRNARSLGLPVLTNSVLTRANQHDLPALAALLVALEVRQMQFAFVHPTGTAGIDFQQVVPRFSEIMPFLRQAIAVARQGGVRVFTEAVPYCMLVGDEDVVVEGRIPETCVVDRPVVIEDYTAYRWREGKIKGPPCAACSYATLCEGPWREYPAGYGWSEFVPRSDPPPRPCT